MKKTERIALYRDAFLKGKSEEECQRFDSKDVEKQYGSIMAWKRRNSNNSSAQKKEEATVNSIIALLKKVKQDIPSLNTLSDEDSGKLSAAINDAMNEVTNFHRNKKALLLQKLETERDAINRQSEDINRRIEELRNELG